MEIVEYFITKGADSYAKNGQTLVADDFCPLQMAIGKKYSLKNMTLTEQFLQGNVPSLRQVILLQRTKCFGS